MEAFFFKSLVGGLEHFLFSIINGIILPIDQYFSEGLKPPTRSVLNLNKAKALGWVNWASGREAHAELIADSVSELLESEGNRESP